MVARYYAQSTDTDDVFLSRQGKSWQVFDREILDRQGGVRAIAMCVNRDTAFRIRDALNKEGAPS